MTDAISQYIEALDQQWQQEVCQELRKLLHEADPDITETIKWHAPFFEHAGQVCSMSIAREFVRLVFMKGAQLPSSRLFTKDSQAKMLRTIKIEQGQMVPAQEIIGLVREAVKLNK